MTDSGQVHWDHAGDDYSPPTALPVLPGTAAALTGPAEALRDLVDAAGLVRRDPGLAARVLRVASASIDEAQATLSLDHACDWLGARGTSAILREALSLPGLPADPWSGYQERCVLTALAARCIAESVGHPDPGNLYAAGLLQGVGVLALAASESAPPGLGAAQAGRLLAHNWHLPESLIALLPSAAEPISATPAREVVIVQLASALAANFGCRDREQNRRAAPRILGLAQQLGIAAGELAPLLKRIQAAVELDQQEVAGLKERLKAAVAEVPAPTPVPEVEPEPELAIEPEPVEAESPTLPPAEDSAPPSPVLTEPATWLRGELRVRPANPEQPKPAKIENGLADTDTEEPEESPAAILMEQARAWPLLRIGAAVALGVVLILCILIARHSDSGAAGNSGSELTLPTTDGAKEVAIPEAIAFISQHPIAPETPGYLVALGKYYEAQQNLQEAAKYYQVLADNFPAWPGTRDIYLPLATAYDQAHNTDAATRIYRLIIKTFPETAPEYLQAKTRLDAGP